MMSGIETKNNEFKALLDKYLGRRPEAYRWTIALWQLGHDIDDVVDIPERRASNAFLGAVWSKYIDILSAEFYHRYLERLYPVVKICHHTYLDSLEWENSDVPWKATYADVFRCSGSHLIIAVIEIVVYEETGSYDLAHEAAREVSMLAKECAWYSHHKDNGEKV
jgi:hypothetical protein